MVGAQRRFLAILTVLAVLGMGAQAALGAPELMLFFAPLLLLVGLLLGGYYVGEDRILARRISAGRLRAPRALPRPVTVMAWQVGTARLAVGERAPPVAVALPV
jgi:hypothetical protein